MPKIYLVRHAKPAASWGEDPDPGLDATGIAQARETAENIAVGSSPLPILSSPLRRCRETAQPLEAHWQRTAEIFMPVAEIPSPPLGLNERHAWLQRAMAGTWSQMQSNAPAGSPDFQAWRDTVIRSVCAQSESAVIYTHFIAINVLVGAAQESDAVVCFRPDHASVTVIEATPSGIQVIELGRQAVTSVLTRAG